MQSQVSLKDYTTMHLGGATRFLATANTREELFSLISEGNRQQVPLLVLGDGSNLIVGDMGFPGLTILNRVPGFEITAQNPTEYIVKMEAGENWDVAVKRTTDEGLSGIECLSGIPGRVGAAPIQNIGAYGQEVADTLVEVEAYDTLTNKIVTISSEECHFSYRHSIFNTTMKRRYVVLSVVLKLTKSQLQPPFYGSLSQYLESHNITDFSPISLRNAVIGLRATKLPDPTVLPNTGSFFKNPIIQSWEAQNLKNEYDNPPLYDMGDGTYKVSAGWLIEQVGLKGYTYRGMRVYDKNALVLVNESANSYQDLAAIREYIIDTVRDTFRINLEQEPEEVGV